MAAVTTLPPSPGWRCSMAGLAWPDRGAAWMRRWHDAQAPSALAGLKRIGLAAMGIGCGLAPGLMLVDFWLSRLACGLVLFGLVLARPPLWALPGFWFGAAFAAWVLLARLFFPWLYVGESWGTAWSWILVYAAWTIGADARWRALLVASGLCGLGLAFIWAAGQAVGALAGGVDPVTGIPSKVPTGLMRHHVPLGFASLVVAAGCIGLSRRPGVRLWAFGLGLGLVLLSTSRGALLTGVAAVLGLLLLRLRFVWAMGAVVFLAGLAVFGLWLMDPVALERLLAGDDPRLEAWRLAGTIARDHPLWGIGGQAVYYHVQFIGPYVYIPAANLGHAHHSLLGLAVNYGWVAAIFHAAWLVALAWAGLRKTRVSRAAAAASFIVAVFLIGGMVDYLAWLLEVTVPGLVFAGALLAHATSPRPDLRKGEVNDVEEAEVA